MVIFVYSRCGSLPCAADETGRLQSGKLDSTFPTSALFHNLKDCQWIVASDYKLQRGLFWLADTAQGYELVAHIY